MWRGMHSSTEACSTSTPPAERASTSGSPSASPRNGGAAAGPTDDPSWDPLGLGDDPSGYQYVEVQKPGFGDHSKRLSRAEKQVRKRALRGVDRKQYRHSVPIPPEVEVTAAGTRLFFSGPLGSNAIDLQKVDSKGLAAFRLVRAEDDRINEVQIAGVCKDITQSAKTLVQNRVKGVVRGYLLYMQLVGVGYRVSKDSKDVTYTVHGEHKAQ